MMRSRNLGTVLAALGFGLCLFSCNVSEGDLGDGPIGPGASAGLDTSSWVKDSISGNMRIYATPQTLKAGNKARATITVQVFDENHNPLRQRLVRFAASLGTITASDTTDGEGMATAAYTGVPRNAEAHILASADVGDSLAVVGTSVQLQGVTVKVTPLSLDTLINQAVPVIVTVRDGEGEPVAAASVKLTGAAASVGVTDGAGEFRTTAKSASESIAKVTASALGAEGSASIGFWNSPFFARSRTLLLFAEPSRIPAANNSVSNIKAVLYDENHNPVAGKRIAFAASQGLITPSDVTDSSGSAQVVFHGFAQNADALITASYTQGDSVRVATTTVTLAGIQIEVKPATAEVVVGDTVAVSIHARDAQGQPLPDVQLTLKGAVQSSLRTNPSGTAVAMVTHGSLATVQVSASALGAADSATITFLNELPKGSVVSKPAVGNLRIFVDRSKLKASNTDETPVRVIAFDKFNNPLAGRLVRFTANFGIITASDSTDSRGEATAVYRAVPYNTDVRITASVTVEDSSLSVATTVTLAGLEVEVKPQVNDATLNALVPVAIRVRDGSGNPVPDVTVKFNGNPSFGTTDGDGVFHHAVTNSAQGRKLIIAEALGALDTGYVDFWVTLPGRPVVGPEEVRNMRIFSSRSQLRADNSDFALITVILTNEENNPAKGEVVKFTTNMGIISQTATVDSAGRAVAILHSAPKNGTCKVEATAVGRNLSASTEVIFSGVTLQLSANQTDLKVGELASLEASLRDASGNPIGGDAVAFSLSGPGVFDNEGAAYNTVLRPDGKALVRVNAKQAGTIVARAAALNTIDSLTLNFTNKTLGLSASKRALSVGGSDSTLITATYLNEAGAPVGGAAIAFAANAGTIATPNATTDGNGKATTWFKSATFSGTATVQANGPFGNAQITIDFEAGSAKAVKLSVTADNIAVNGGIANLSAKVTDAQGNLVSGQSVNFKIVQGPGGGESILKPVAVSQSGVAQSQLAAGSIASGYRGVLVVATAGSVSDTSKLTISGPAHIVTVSRPEDDSLPVENAGTSDETTFEYFVGAVVQDVNGNMVADGTEVHFSAVVSGAAYFTRIFDHWNGLGGTLESVKPAYRTVYFDVPFEDINNNAKYDAGIDLDLDGDPAVLRRGEDVNGDGKFDWQASTHDFWFDFNGNGRCDAGVGEDDTVVVSGKTLFADLNANGFRDRSEIIFDNAPFGVCNEPASGDFPFLRREVRDFMPALPFYDNDFAVAIEVSAVTKNGVAHARLRYPRQFGWRLFVNVNAEANGVRDRNGERFLLPVFRN
jgi:hypothetical protein